jgi:adenine deaminase
MNVLSRRIDAALGRIPCDGVIRNVSFLDVFSLTWRKADIAWVDGIIVHTLDPQKEGRIAAKREWDGTGKFLVPGWIDAHVHIESSLVVPDEFERQVALRGTTSAICDPHEFANVMGVPGIQYFLDSATHSAMDLRVMLSSCVPATHLETNGGGAIEVEQLRMLSTHPKALGLAEMMNVPGVLHKDPKILEKVLEFTRRHRPVDGHSPLLRGRALAAYCAAGISSCHETSELQEAQEKLTNGMKVWIREGSVAKDLSTLIPLLNEATSVGIGFCTDDRNPLDIHEEGHLDHLLRQGIAKGTSPEVIFRSASWTVASHYGLHQLGAIAPGYRADVVLLNDVRSVAIERVFLHGEEATERLDRMKEYGQDSSLPEIKNRLSVLKSALKSMKATPPQAHELEGPSGLVHVIGVQPGKILTTRSVEDCRAPGVARLSVLERHGHGKPPANGYVRGFGERFGGAIASSVGHDSHNLIVVGSSTTEMRLALSALISSGGGFVVVKGDSVLAKLDLPVGGIMTEKSSDHVRCRLQELREASRAVGCSLHEPFLQLAFLSLPVIPSLKLTDLGLVDVDSFQLIPVRAS